MKATNHPWLFYLALVGTLTAFTNGIYVHTLHRLGIPEIEFSNEFISFCMVTLVVIGLNVSVLLAGRDIVKRSRD